MSLLDSLLNSILLASLQQQQQQLQQQQQQQQLQQQQQQELSAVRLCVRRQVHELAVHQYSTSSFCGSSHAYLQAMAVHPALVLSETDPLHFVRYCQYNVWTGTQRLCHYWTERLKLFGPDRAFLPLTLTGHGALSPTDIVTLHAGYPAILPDTVTGQHCVLSDRRKWVPESTVEHKLRAWFYICAVLMNKDDDVDVDDDTTTITTGSSSTIRPVLVLVLSATARETTVDWTLVRRISALFATAFPLTPHIHLLNLPHRKRPWIAHQVAQTAIQVFQQWIGTNIHIQLHSTSSSSSNKNNKKKNRVAGAAPLPGTATTALQQDSHTLLTSSSSSSLSLLEQLQALGLTKRGIPVFAGGEWKMEDWYQWCQEREQWEEQRQQQQQQQPLNNNNDTTTTTNKENQAKNGPITTTNNKRTKVTTATTTITATTTTTTTTQSTTQTPTTATTQTPLITQTRTLLEQKRLAHLLQSRRKRERQREEFRLLQEEAVQLQHDHHRLKREHAQLQQWMQQAQNSKS
ncbi:hypothetical protein ACA910_002204 [Epithemia clementina (nom. ined.)]